MAEPVRITSELRKENPRQWLAWSLDELIEAIDRDDAPEGVKFREELLSMRATVDEWPDNLYDRHEGQRMIDRLAEIRAQMEGEGDDDQSTGYSVTLDRSAGARRRSQRPGGKTSSAPPEKRKTSSAPPEKAKTSSAPPAKDTTSSAPPEKAKTSAGKDKKRKKRKKKPQVIEPESTSLALRSPRLPQIATTEVIDAPPPSGGRTARRSSRPPMETSSLGQLAFEHIDVSEDVVDSRIALVREPDGPVAEAYRALHYRLGASSDARVIMMSTSSAEEHSAASAVNLALAMAEEAERVLLVEARFADASIANLLGYVPEMCFGRRLSKHRRTPDAPWRIAQMTGTSLSVLAVNPEQSTPPALDAQAFGTVVEGFREAGYEYIVVDGPPAIEHSDARFLAPCVEGVVMCIEAGSSQKRRLRRSLDILDATSVLGYVLLE